LVFISAGGVENPIRNKKSAQKQGRQINRRLEFFLSIPGFAQLISQLK
jgi:hypothetical protein